MMYEVGVAPLRLGHPASLTPSSTRLVIRWLHRWKSGSCQHQRDDASAKRVFQSLLLPPRGIFGNRPEKCYTTFTAVVPLLKLSHDTSGVGSVATACSVAIEGMKILILGQHGKGDII